MLATKINRNLKFLIITKVIIIFLVEVVER
jgi:hypothetical protein